MNSVAPRTEEAIGRRFAMLLGRIQPRQESVDRSALRATVIRKCLRGSHDVAQPRRVGSFYKGTAIHSRSDLDLFIVLTRGEVRWGSSYKSSATVLNSFRETLQSRYRQTAIRRDGAAITVSFGDGVSVDVVPAVYERQVSCYPMYHIPDGAGGWMPTSPDASARFFRDANARAGGKLAHLIQLVKYWAHCRSTSVPLSSYHVEMVLSQTDISTGPRRYSWMLADAFRILALRNASSLNDPLGIGERIPLANTEAKRRSAIHSLTTAADRALRAIESAQAGRLPTAIAAWKSVFGGNFPS